MKRFFLLLALPALSASAVSIDPLAPARGFNVFVKEDATLARGHMHGALAAGGNLNLQGNYEFMNDIQTPYRVDGQVIQLVVGKQINFGGGATVRVNSPNFIKVGDLTGTNVWTRDNNNAVMDTRLNAGTWNSHPRLELRSRQDAASIAGPSGIDFAAAFQSLEANSLALSELTPTGTFASLGGGQVRFDLQTGTNVFNLTAAQLNSFTEIKFSQLPSLDAPVVFNISGTGADFVWRSPNFPGISNAQASYILFNFYDSTGKLTIGNGGQTQGSILAPKADVFALNNSDMAGQIIAKSFTHKGGQIHDSPFKGTVYVPSPSAVPDSGSTFAICLLAVALAFGVAARAGSFKRPGHSIRKA